MKKNLFDSGKSILRLHSFDLIQAGALLIYITLLVFSPGIFRQWLVKYYYHNKHIFSGGLLQILPLIFTFAFLIVSVRRIGNRSRILILTLFLIGVCMQWSFSFLEGISGRRLSTTLIHSHFGHSEFVLIAYQEESPLRLAREYEYLCQHDPRFIYAKSKPPGHLLFYSLTAEAFRLLGHEQYFNIIAESFDFAQRGPYTAFATFATIVFSFFSYLPVFILVWIGKYLDGELLGEAGALAYILIPSVTLITMHLDQVVYPIFVALGLLGAIVSIHRHPVYAFGISVIVYMGIYTSFSLLFLIPMVLLIWFCYFWVVPERRNAAIWNSVVFTVGLIASFLVFRYLLNFQLLEAYRRSIEHHSAWRNVTGQINVRENIGNLVQLVLWLGLPATLIYIRRIAMIWQNTTIHIDPLDLFALLYCLLILVVSIFGRTVDEIGRLWFPLMIPMLIPIGRELVNLYGRRPYPYVIWAFVMITLLKNFQDFN